MFERSEELRLSVAATQRWFCKFLPSSEVRLLESANLDELCIGGMFDGKNIKQLIMLTMVDNYRLQ